MNDEAAAQSRIHARKNPCVYFIQGDGYQRRSVPRASYKDTINDLNHGEFRTSLRVLDGQPVRTLTLLPTSPPPKLKEPRPAIAVGYHAPKPKRKEPFRVPRW